MVSSTVAIALGIVGTLAVFAVVRWDAKREAIGRPRLWAAVAAVPVLVGVSLYAFVPTAPMTGIIMTANTGLVLYGFEREVVGEGDDPAEPGWLPGDPTGGDGGDSRESGETRADDE
ncbi:hypothetical protein [Natronobiforma cellulositropha]|uniref:hypothetical protein n=1 Tax=Natronobiforma cellulositropha TaxID=1679076 RepID=UPI0021D60E14|nr:hypothetical protein [Natronobiforma cellulositropha]